MAYIHKVPVNEATGKLKTIFDDAIQRAGKVFQIVHIQSLNVDALSASMAMYMAIMFGPSPLSRRQREMIATLVSRLNHCHY
jgi:alkylhydroperoxidase family enzyme